ncbi:MAG: L-threonylcarbamoyladenylate synthase [Promethearchaeota archaeon]
METKILRLNPDHFDPKKLKEAANIIQNGDIVGFPTETVYGLGGSIYSDDAIKKIFQAKGRPMDNPLIVHISSMEMLKDLVLEIPENVQKICEHYWPGPLTILFRKSPIVADSVTAGLPTVAIRMPSHPIAKSFIEVAGVPIAAPSANSSGRPSPTTAEHVYHDLHGKIPYIIDGGKTNFGVESTVIDVHRNPPMILRPGGMNYEDLVSFIPNLQIYEKSISDSELEKHPSTPGLKYTHYSPNAYLILIEFNEMKSSDLSILSSMRHKLEKLHLKYIKMGKKVGIIHTHSGIQLSAQIINHSQTEIYPLGAQLNPDQSNQDVIDNFGQVAQGLFSAMRNLDELGVEIILVEGISEKYEGLAVMNRLRKAASEIIEIKKR